MLIRLISLIVALGLGIIGSTELSAGVGDYFKSEEIFFQWSTFYYLYPETEKVPYAILYYADSNAFSKHKDTRMPMAAFFSVILANDNQLLEKTLSSIDNCNSDNAKIFYTNILWYMDTPKSKELYARIQREWKKDNLQNVFYHLNKMSVQNILDNPVSTALDLDMLWASFFASGKSEYIKNIISALDKNVYNHGEAIMVRGAAKWSLKSNAIQHERVLQICQEEQEMHKLDSIGIELRELLKEIEIEKNGLINNHNIK
jgi:hypothetical protein